MAAGQTEEPDRPKAQLDGQLQGVRKGARTRLIRVSDRVEAERLHNHFHRDRNALAPKTDRAPERGCMKLCSKAERIIGYIPQRLRASRLDER